MRKMKLLVFGNINILRGVNETSRTHYLKMDFKNDEILQQRNFIMDKDSELWSQHDESCSDRKYYRTKAQLFQVVIILII